MKLSLICLRLVTGKLIIELTTRKDRNLREKLHQANSANGWDSLMNGTRGTATIVTMMFIDLLHSSPCFIASLS